jgi:chromosome segregation ATPase
MYLNPKNSLEAKNSNGGSFLNLSKSEISDPKNPSFDFNSQEENWQEKIESLNLQIVQLEKQVSQKTEETEKLLVEVANLREEKETQVTSFEYQQKLLKEQLRESFDKIANMQREKGIKEELILQKENAEKILKQTIEDLKLESPVQKLLEENSKVKKKKEEFFFSFFYLLRFFP